MVKNIYEWKSKALGVANTQYVFTCKYTDAICFSPRSINIY